MTIIWILINFTISDIFHLKIDQQRDFTSRDQEIWEIDDRAIECHLYFTYTIEITLLWRVYI